MSVPREPDKARVVLSVLCARWERVEGLFQDLDGLFGPSDYDHGPMDFGLTSYYDGELGTPITRRLLSFSTLAAQDGLSRIKLATNELERKYSRSDGRRLVNLDPGFITLERLVLATGKNFSHRIYQGAGIWADLTLVYRGNEWMVLPWTFPDYGSREMLAHMSALREMYKKDRDLGRTRPE